MWMCNDRLSTRATELWDRREFCMYCWYQASRGYGSVGVRCVHCITSSRYLCLDTPSVQVDQPPGEAPRHPLLFFPSNQSFLLITSVTKSDCFPPHPRKYRCHLCCRFALVLGHLTLFSDHPFPLFLPFFSLPISTAPTCLN